MPPNRTFALTSVQKNLTELFARIVLVGYVICPIWFLNDRLLLFFLSPDQGGMACQEDIPDIWSILILEIIELR